MNATGSTNYVPSLMLFSLSAQKYHIYIYICYAALLGHNGGQVAKRHIYGRSDVEQ